MIAVFALVLAGCFTAKPPKQAPPPPTATEAVIPVQSDVERANAKFPNYSVAELTEGKMLYKQNCGTCHGLKEVTAFSEASWNNIVPDMCNKVNQKEPILDAAAQQKILNYVVAVRNASR